MSFLEDQKTHRHETVAEEGRSELNEKLYEVVKQFVEAEFGCADSVLLYGSYARNEGAWFRKDGEIFPYNDLDVLVVSEKPVSLENVESFKKKVKRATGLRWVDVAVTNIEKLKGLPVSVYSYDLRESCIVLKGKKSAVSSMRKCSARDIPLKEGETLFFTRLWAFCGGLLASSELDLEQARLFHYQMAKAVLAAVDCILIGNGEYHWSYKVRCENVRKKISEDEFLLVQWALSQKLSPHGQQDSLEETEEIYLACAIFFRKFTLKLLSEMYCRQFSTIVEFKTFYRKQPKVFLKRLGYLLLKRSFRFEKVYWTNIVHMNVLSYILKEEGAASGLQESAGILEKFGHHVSNDFEQIKFANTQLRESL